MTNILQQSKKTKIFRDSAEILGKKQSYEKLTEEERSIARAAYGNKNSEFGWDIHHRSGNPNNNDLSNLEAVHFKTH